MGFLAEGYIGWGELLRWMMVFYLSNDYLDGCPNADHHMGLSFAGVIVQTRFGGFPHWWGRLAQDRQEWRKVCDRSSSGSTSSVAPDSRLYCDGCGRGFSRPQDKASSNVRLRHAAGSVNVLVSCSQCFEDPRQKCSWSRKVWWLMDSVCRKAGGHHLLVAFYPGGVG